MDLTGVALRVDPVKAYGGTQPLVELLRKLAVLIGIRQAHALPSTPPTAWPDVRFAEVLPSPIPAGTLSTRSVDEIVTPVN